MADLHKTNQNVVSERPEKHSVRESFFGKFDRLKITIFALLLSLSFSLE